MIDAIAKKSHSHKGIPLRIRCKDFRELTFLFPRDRERECQDVYESLTRFAFPGMAQGRGWGGLCLCVAYSMLFCSDTCAAGRVQDTTGAGRQ